MIDQDKMRALAAKLREWNWLNDAVPQQAADAIDLLLAEVEGLRAARIAYASEFAPDAEGLPDTGNIHANIRRLKADLEAAAADKLDAERYRLLNSIPFGPGVPAAYRGIYFSFAVSDGKPGFIRSCRGEEMSSAIDAALAQRQGEGS
ncbi:hypothetical protein LA345_25715 [Burkholderia vietnamiensis]|uniref:Uncharacterized protein n=1 Tax=Burkholderia vietnamiensis (strain G4 / LMG 22486) TaxID=269482 RepID=A4JD05_BURVG|nr:hypothetical protein [Burkholderia vietnamiensis]ABO54158.1 hypothetical protein Bcep1808_1147 [Burkholderia vietnamiensis G4]MCB4347284.1 hypothetical protein [Burkholderia vietnamiensis]